MPDKQVMTAYAQEMINGQSGTEETTKKPVSLATNTVVHKKTAVTKGKLIVPNATESKPARQSTNVTTSPVVEKLTTSATDDSGFFDDDPLSSRGDPAPTLLPSSNGSAMAHGSSADPVAPLDDTSKAEATESPQPRHTASPVPLVEGNKSNGGVDQRSNTPREDVSLRVNESSEVMHDESEELSAPVSSKASNPVDQVESSTSKGDGSAKEDLLTPSTNEMPKLKLKAPIDIPEPPVPVTDWNFPKKNNPTSATLSPGVMDRDLSTHDDKNEVDSSSSQPTNSIHDEDRWKQQALELQERFSEQLQRLEENHQMETQQWQNQYNKDMDQWQRKFETLSKEYQREKLDRKRLEESNQAEEKSLKSEIARVNEMLELKDEEEKKLQESHLQALRDMEREVFRKEDESKENETKVKTHEVSHRSTCS